MFLIRNSCFVYHQGGSPLEIGKPAAHLLSDRNYFKNIYIMMRNSFIYTQIPMKRTTRTLLLHLFELQKETQTLPIYACRPW